VGTGHNGETRSDGDPEISVIIPTKDRPQRLRAALAGVLRQTGVALEVIIVDDGGRPEHIPALKVLEHDHRVRIVRNETALSPAAARNRGVAEARAPWVAFLDDDDIWAPWKLQAQLDAAATAGARWAWCGACCIDPRGKVLSIDYAPEPDEARRMLPSGNVIPAGASNVIARRDLVQEVGGFDLTIFHMPDWDMWLRLDERDPGAAHHELLVGYLQHDAMLSLRHTAVLDADIARVDAKVRARGLDPLADYRIRRAMFEWMAQRHLAGRNHRFAARTYWRSALLCRKPGDAMRAVGSLAGRRGVSAVERAVHLVTLTLYPTDQNPPLERPGWLDDYVGFFAAG
jgi:glycosyltransferase involved in cell wall biosynthesis